jgi:prephenate dehydratase
MQISIQGFHGSFHHIVAAQFFPEADLLTRASFAEVFVDVSGGQAQWGIVAIENSIAGAILENFDRIKSNNLHIVGEQYLRIEHNLIAMPGAKLENLSEVWSHPMALKQCQQFLQQNPHLKAVEVADTAGAVQDIMQQGLRHVAGIASHTAAQIYGAEILAEGIETDKQNFTRFLILHKSAQEQLPQNAITNFKNFKYSLYVETDHRPGALRRVLEVLDVFNLNMTMLVSRPIIGEPWHYGFYIDFVTHRDDLDGFWDALKRNTITYKVLGSYKAANIL